MMHTVWYWAGGSLYGYWRPTIKTPSYKLATERVTELERMGYPAMVVPITDHPGDKPPTWWDFNTLTRKGS